MASGKPDFGCLLAAFGRGTSSRPAQANRAEIRLPSWERLLEIDKESEGIGIQREPCELIPLISTDGRGLR